MPSIDAWSRTRSPTIAQYARYQGLSVEAVRRRDVVRVVHRTWGIEATEEVDLQLLSYTDQYAAETDVEDRVDGDKRRDGWQALPVPGLAHALGAWSPKPEGDGLSTAYVLGWRGSISVTVAFRAPPRRARRWD